MRSSEALELPEEQERAHRRAVRLEILTILFLVSAITVIYLTLGASQSMKTVWVEDILSLIPPLAFLVAARVRRRPANERFPYGYHRAVSIAFLCAALALVAMGAFLLYDSVMKLVSAEHPSIGTVQLFGRRVWLGWLMLAALTYTAIPPVLLGRAKLPLARKLHDKVLYADADMNKADWLTAVAGIVGVTGIGIGWWWTDATAASFISLSILRDGVGNLRAVVADLMDAAPTSVDHERPDPLPNKVEKHLRGLPWVADVRVRLREEGHVYFGEVLVVPSSERDLVANLEAALRDIHEMDWRLTDVVLSPVRDLDLPTVPEPAREG